MGRLALGFAFTALMAGSPALAQEPWLDANSVYGTVEGCHYAETGNVDSDDMFVLRAGGLEFYASSCLFALVSPETRLGHAVVAICRDEGETEQTIQNFRIVRNSDRTDAYDVFDGDGMAWATADRC